ncbi:predicted protein [Coccidioides posadasii str. Silveira]|uniref:Predicted protein n=2 Tax=Coccidioides posadasii (strain RMSCC 757 / Silveira) TaxID=443226 RepID=E9D993_COCPS|nr:predicted protein [Coccidioides posadasii str. Silveira]
MAGLELSRQIYKCIERLVLRPEDSFCLDWNGSAMEPEWGRVCISDDYVPEMFYGSDLGNKKRRQVGAEITSFATSASWS